MAVPTPLFPPPSSPSSPATAATTPRNPDKASGEEKDENQVPRGLNGGGYHAEHNTDAHGRPDSVAGSSSSAAAASTSRPGPGPGLGLGLGDKMAAIAEDPAYNPDVGNGNRGRKTAGMERLRGRARSTSLVDVVPNGNGVACKVAANPTEAMSSPSDPDDSQSPNHHDENGSSVNGERKSGQAFSSSPSLSAAGGSGPGVTGEKGARDSGYEGATASADEPVDGLAPAVSPQRNQEKDRERILKLSPSKMQELTSSPQSIPYRAVPAESPDHGRRVMSDNAYTVASRSGSSDGYMSQGLGEMKISTDIVAKLRASRDLHLDDPPESSRPVASSVRNRPHASRTVSTPSSSSRRQQQLPSANSDRLAQTWASRSKQDRPSIARMEPEPKHHLGPSPQITEPALPSPMPPSIPLPPVSIPTYLQLELSSGRPSPLYIHRSATSDFPYESSRVKLERLMNFLMLPPAVEQVLWFGVLACLDSWLYSFTILPLRFVKAVYILLESWAGNLGAEFRYVSGFVYNGVGRVWRRRRTQASAGQAPEQRGADADGRSRGSAGKQDPVPAERESRARTATESRRRHRPDTHRHHRRQKSTPSALLPDDKADILNGLLMISTCCVLMYFDASRMYHWIRGQAAIKLYVIYNVLEVSDKLFAAIGQDVLECLFSREALERRPDGRSKVFRPFGLFLLALAYTVIHATALFYQVMTLNVAVNSYSNALITLLLSNQFVEIKSTVFKKFEKENLFQLTCADVVERFQLWLMLTIIASRNIVETGAFNFIGSLGSTWNLGGNASTMTNSTPLSTPPRTASSILPQSFTILPSSLFSSFSKVNSFLPSLAQVLGPFLVVLGSEMLVDWLKHGYINKFNNVRPSIYNRFLDILTKDYYTNAFGDQNLTRRLGLPVIPLSCLFFRVSVQTYKMFLAASLPQHPSSTAVEGTSLSSIHNQYAPAPVPSTPSLTLRTIIPSSAAHIGAFFRSALTNAMPTPAQSVYIFTTVLLLLLFIVLLILKLLLGMGLLAYSRSRYKAMKGTETGPPNHHQPPTSAQAPANGTAETTGPPRGRDYTVEGSRRFGGWGTVEVNEDKRRWIYADDPEGLKGLRAYEEKEKKVGAKELNMDHVQRYEMVAKRIW